MPRRRARIPWVPEGCYIGSLIQILLAEDNPADVYLIRHALAENNVECSLEIAHHGREALAFLRADKESTRNTVPDLILLDLNLPQHDGMEILQHIRRSRRLEGGESECLCVFEWGSGQRFLSTSGVSQCSNPTSISIKGTIVFLCSYADRWNNTAEPAAVLLGL